MPPRAKLLEVVDPAWTGQMEQSGSLTGPSHLRPVALFQVVSKPHVLVEILHGTGDADTGFVEPDHYNHRIIET
nr:hypothetical protein [Geminisphaera colitermitum]